MILTACLISYFSSFYEVTTQYNKGSRTLISAPLVVFMGDIILRRPTWMSGYG